MPRVATYSLEKHNLQNLKVDKRSTEVKDADADRWSARHPGLMPCPSEVFGLINIPVVVYTGIQGYVVLLSSANKLARPRT